MPPRRKKGPNMESNITSEQDSEEEVSRREEKEEERMREMEREEERRLRKEEEEQDLADRLKDARKESEKPKNSEDESEDADEKRKDKEREDEYYKEGSSRDRQSSSRDRQSRWDREKESKDSAERELMKNDFHRVINSNEDLRDAIDNMESKRKEMKRYESVITKKLKDLKMRKTITATEIHYERVHFEEAYDKHADKCKEQVDAITRIQGLSRADKDIVKRSTNDMKEAMFKSYDCFMDNFNESMREIERDTDKTTSHNKERSTTTFPVDDWRPNSTFEPDKKLDINNGFTSYRRWETSVEMFFEQGRGRSKPTSKQTTNWIERFLSESLETEMKPQWDNNPDMTFQECFEKNMEMVERCFMQYFPLSVRRSILFEWRMPDINVPEEGILELKKIMNEAHFDKVSPDEYAIHVSITQTGDRELKKALLIATRDKGMTMKVFNETIKDYRRVERTIINDERSDDTKRVGRVEANNGGSGSRESSRERGGYKGRNPICFRCSGKHYIRECKEKQQRCPEKDCGRDHFKSSHGVFIKWKREREEREREKSPSRYRDRSKSREREREREKPYKKREKEEKKESNTEPPSVKQKKDTKTKRKIKMVEVTTDDDTEAETEEDEKPPKPKTKKLRRVKERSATPRPRSSYYKEILTDEEDLSEDEPPKRIRRVKTSNIRMVKKSRERTDEEYNFLMRETFDTED